VGVDPIATTWSSQSSTQGAPAWNNAAAVFDPGTQTVVLVTCDRRDGDVKVTTPNSTSDFSGISVWSWNGIAFTNVSLGSAGPHPQCRGGFLLAADPGRKRVVLAGGVQDFVYRYAGQLDTGTDQYVDDSWSWDSVSGQWSNEGQGPLPFILESAVTYDDWLGEIVAFGGWLYPPSGVNPFDTTPHPKTLQDFTADTQCYTGNLGFWGWVDCFSDTVLTPRWNALIAPDGTGCGLVMVNGDTYDANGVNRQLAGTWRLAK